MSASSKGLNVKTRRVISYVVLVIITIMCLFWFYVLFVNSTRSHADLKRFQRSAKHKRSEERKQLITQQ